MAGNWFVRLSSKVSADKRSPDWESSMIFWTKMLVKTLLDENVCVKPFILEEEASGDGATTRRDDASEHLLVGGEVNDSGLRCGREVLVSKGCHL